MKKILTILSIPTLFYSCAITRAESGYELNRRLGLPDPENKETVDAGKFKTNSSVPLKPFMPARVPPVIERVWLFDRNYNGFWQQGTWLWVEVEPSRWLNEVDPGGGKLLK